MVGVQMRCDPISDGEGRVGDATDGGHYPRGAIEGSNEGILEGGGLQRGIRLAEEIDGVQTDGDRESDQETSEEEDVSHKEKLNRAP